MLTYIYIFLFFLLISILIILVLLKKGSLKFTRKISISDILTFLSITIALTALALTAYNANTNYKTSKQQIKNATNQLTITKKQLDDAREEKKSDQAVKIASWITNLTATLKTPNAINDNLASEITVQNSSEIPVYKVFVFTLSNRNSPTFKSLKINSNELAYLETLTPGKVDMKLHSSGMAMGGEHESVAMIFTDSKSNIWYRDNYGKLTSVTQKELDTVLEQSGVADPYSQYVPLN